MAIVNYEKLFISFTYLFAIVAFVLLLLYAFLTEFSMTDPEKEAAFFSDVTKSEGAQNFDLSAAHKSDRELQEWLSQVASEALSFDSTDYQDNARKILPNFTREGFQAYQEYLRTSGIFENLKTGSNRLSVFVEQQPLLLSDGEVGGVYRWLYQVPVTISFIPRGISDLSMARDIVTRKLTLRVQLTRAVHKDDPRAVQIEGWTATVRR